MFSPSPSEVSSDPLVLCFPHAGGGYAACRPWRTLLSGVADVHVAVLPGRELRLRHPLATSLADVVSSAADALGRTSHRPMIFLGHSFGALVAYETAHELARRRSATPLHLFLIGLAGPGPRCRPPIHALPDDDFVNAVAAFGGMPEAVIENRELLDLVLPALRQDFRLLETWSFAADDRLHIPLDVFAGHDDGVRDDELARWCQCTSAAVNIHRIDGAHFPTAAGCAAIAAIVSETLSQARCGELVERAS